VLEFLNGLGDERLVVFHETVTPALELHGPDIGSPYCEQLDDGFSEISWGRCRIYCSIIDPRRFMMYVGVIKLWPRFRPRDRRLCEHGRADVESGNYDQESRQLLYLARLQKRSANGSA
jgi:hypothetical protein